MFPDIKVVRFIAQGLAGNLRTNCKSIVSPREWSSTYIALENDGAAGGVPSRHIRPDVVTVTLTNRNRFVLLVALPQQAGQPAFHAV